jgi:hypothetical protein
MQAFDERREADELEMLDAAVGADLRAAGPAPEDPAALSDGFVHDVLAAVAGMALRSKRRQADLDAALWCAGLTAGRGRRLAALERLREQGCVEQVVELSDGGVLLSLTALGLDRLGGAGR